MKRFALFAVLLITASPAYAQQPAFLKGVKSVHVQVAVHGDSAGHVNADLWKGGVEGFLRQAGIQTSSSEHNLVVTVQGVEYDRRLGYHVSAEFVRTALVMINPGADKGQFLPAPMTLWEDAGFGTVGIRLASSSLWESAAELVAKFLKVHAQANLGYKGPAVREVQVEGSHHFKGVRLFSVEVSMDPSLPLAIDQAWAVRVLESRLAGTGVGIIPNSRMGRMVVDVRTMDFGYRWLTVITVRYLRSGIVALPERKALLQGEVWASRRITFIGKLAFNVRGDIMEAFDAFVKEIKATK